MGGNVFPNARRITSKEMSERICELRTILNDITIYEILAYSNKPDHGDIDLVVDVDECTVEYLCRKLLPNVEDLSVNGDIISIVYREAHVDFICHKKEEMQFAACYYHYNDLGLLMSRIATVFNFKFGHNGLNYVVREQNRPNLYVPVNLNFHDCIRLLGFKQPLWYAGFDDLVDMFEYIYTNRFFKKEWYALDSITGKRKNRALKRKTYMAFLDWLEDREDPDNQIPTEEGFMQLVAVKDPTFPVRLQEAYNAIEQRQKEREARKLNYLSQG